MAIGQKGIKAGKAYVELGVDDKMARGLRRAQMRLKAFGASVTQIGARLAAVGTIAAGAMLGAAKVFSSVGDQVAKMSKRTGVSVETLSELRFVASQTGTEFTALENAFRKMQRSIYDAGRGLSTQVDAFADLGLAAKDFKGLSPEQQFKLLADRISGVEDPTKKAAIAMSLLGRSGTALLPMFEKGAAGIEELQKQARKLGLTISAKDAEAAEDFTDTMDVLGHVAKMAAFHIGSALAGSLEKAANAIREKVTAIIEWVKANKEAIVTAAKWVLKIAAVGVALIVVGQVISSVGVVVGAFAVLLKGGVIAVKALGVALTFLAAHPVIAAFVVIAATIGAVVLAIRKATYHTAELSSRMSELRQKGDEQRRSDLLRMKRLEQLAEKEKLNNAEMAETKDLIGKLHSRYGDLGIVLDETAGKISGVTEAQKRLNDAMKKAAMAQAQAELAEQVSNLNELDREKRSVWFSTSKVNELGEKQIVILKKIAAARLRLKALREGTEGSLTGEGGTEAAKIQQKITTEKQRQLEIERELDALAAKRRTAAATDASRWRTIQELRLRAELKGYDLEVALLALRRKQALRDARDAGESLELVKQEYDLRAKLLEAGRKIKDAVVAAKRAIGVRGTFYAARAQGLGSGGAIDRVADNTQQIARTNKKILTEARQGGLAFS